MKARKLEPIFKQRRKPHENAFGGSNAKKNKTQRRGPHETLLAVEKPKADLTSQRKRFWAEKNEEKTRLS